MKKKHRDNLLKLADYLDKLPDDYDRFNMAFYMADDESEQVPIDEISKPDCGTVACAAGHGPAAGIRVYRDRDWDDYINRVFGAHEVGGGYHYMFSGNWTEYDNTIKGAVARIRTFVKLGRTPEGWRFYDPKVTS